MAKKGSKESDNFGLMIAALVAIVAVVGLVILFSSGGTGAVTNVNAVCEGNWQYDLDSHGWTCQQVSQPVGGSFPEGGAYADSWGVSREQRERDDASRGFTQKSVNLLDEKVAI